VACRERISFIRGLWWQAIGEERGRRKEEKEGERGREMKRGGGDEMGEERRYSNLIFYYFIFLSLTWTSPRQTWADPRRKWVAEYLNSTYCGDFITTFVYK
jgi:hypothetical protein